MNVKLRSVHTLKKVLFNSLGLKRRILINWALWGIHDFKTPNYERKTTKCTYSKKVLFNSLDLKRRIFIVFCALRHSRFQNTEH